MFQAMRVLIIAILLTSMGFSTGCNRSNYNSSDVLDISIAGGDCYFLLKYDEGAYKESFFPDGGHTRRINKRTLVVGKCSLVERSSGIIEPLVCREFTEGPMLDCPWFLLCGTNRCVGALPNQEVWQLIRLRGVKQHSSGSDDEFIYNTGEITFSAGNRYMIGCGSQRWVFDTTMPGSVVYSNQINLPCGQWRSFPTEQFSVNNQLDGVAIYDAFGKRLNNVVMVVGLSGNRREIAIAKGVANFKSYHKTKSGERLLFNEDQGLENAILLDEMGLEVGRTNMGSFVTADEQCSTVVSLGRFGGVGLDQNVSLTLKVWHPEEKRLYTIMVDSAPLIKAATR